MSKRHDDMDISGQSKTWRNDTYDCLDIDDSDERVERFIEEGRREYYFAWFEYISDFE